MRSSCLLVVVVAAASACSEPGGNATESTSSTATDATSSSSSSTGGVTSSVTWIPSTDCGDDYQPCPPDSEDEHCVGSEGASICGAYCVEYGPSASYHPQHSKENS